MMYRKISCIFILLFAWVISPLFAQQPHFINYNVEDGLPSNEIFHVIQDTQGYMWFATNHGVSRFDGYGFKNYDLSDGLPDNTVFEIYEDYKGRIWFISFSLKLSYFHKGEIHLYRHNDKLINTFYENRVQNKLAFHVDKKDNVYVGIRNYGILKVDSLGVTERLNNTKDNSLDIYKVENKYLISKISGEYKNVTLHQADSLVKIKLHIPSYKGYHLQNNDFVIKQDHTLILAHFGKIYLFEDNKFKRSKYIGNHIVWLSRESPGKFWISTGSGVRLMHAGNLKTQKLLFSDQLVTSVFRDKEGAYWFTTSNNGINYVPNLHFLNITEEHGLYSENVEKVEVDSSGKIWMGFTDPIVSSYDGSEFENYHLPSRGIKGIHDIEYDQFNNRIIVSRNIGVYSLKYQNVSKITDHSALDIMIHPPDTLLMSLSGGYIVYANDKVIFNSCRTDSFCMRTNTIFRDDDQSVYLGGLDGLWVYREGQYYHMGKDHPDLYFRITEIERMGEYLVCVTRGAGLMLIKEDKILKITEKEGLISNSIKTILVDGQTIWAATNKGISKIEFLNAKTGFYKIINIHNANGLPYPQVNDLAMLDTMVYAATPKGLTYFPKEHVKINHVAPRLHIESVKINGKDTIPQSHYELRYNQNHISIEYVGLSYRSTGSVLYKHRLSGLDSNWVSSSRTSKSYLGLSPGTYRFSVLAQNEDGFWTDQPGTISFVIKRPFWKTWWFLMLAGLCVFGTVASIIYYRLQMIKKRNELMQNINEYKQKILRQQMNPHFIFNTLNSIQYFLLDEDTTASLTYLTKFAKLMRIVLDNSQQTFVPIEDEIRGLDLYLELECLRYEESFDYEIHIDDKVNTFEYKIPALLLQPYVENSIRHGLLHKKEKGKLNIGLKLNGNQLLCVIEDNGIGRKRAEEIKMSKGPMNRSLGSKITEDRIKVLNSLYSDEIDINYVDLTTAEGKPNGTRVEIRLPFMS